MKSGVKGCAGFLAALCAGALGLAACGSSTSTKDHTTSTTVAPATTVAPTTPTTVKTSTSGGVSY
jgi:ABC-type oligopeptide transport system substrate-binding subunit